LPRTIQASKIAAITKTTKTITRWAVHKQGTEQFGYLCSFKSEAENMLNDLKKDILNMPDSEKAKYSVVEVTVSWSEQDNGTPRREKA